MSGSSGTIVPNAIAAARGRCQRLVLFGWRPAGLCDPTRRERPAPLGEKNHATEDWTDLRQSGYHRAGAIMKTVARYVLVQLVVVTLTVTVVRRALGEALS